MGHVGDAADLAQGVADALLAMADDHDEFGDAGAGEPVDGPGNQRAVGYWGGGFLAGEFYR